jgi:hypothetical protein
MTKKIVVEVTDELAQRMNKLSPEVDWSGTIRKYLEREINIIESYAFLDKIKPVA